MSSHIVQTADRSALLPAPGPGVRRATVADAATISRTLTSAFHNDPIFEWCVPDPHKREQHLPAWFRFIVDALLEHDQTYCTDDAAGAALWVPAGVAPMTEEQEARLGEITANIGDVEVARFGALIESMEALHPHEPHLYLWFVGVDFGRQGQGVGGSLLESQLTWADQHVLPAYLEATSGRNRALYERHGFEVTGELSVDGSPPMWSMWRNPR